MSSHRRRTKHFSRDSKPRRALLKGLMTSLVEHGRIKTTVDRAKETRRHIERAITAGKKGDLGATRLLMSRLDNKDAVAKIITDIAPRMKTRPGGYTRVIKIGRRPGDTAEMAFLEFVDYDWKKAGGDETEGKKAEGKDAKAAAKPAKKAAKKATAALASRKKTARKSQKKSRAAARA